MARRAQSTPGHAQMSVDEAVRECAEAQSLGIGGVRVKLKREKGHCRVVDRNCHYFRRSALCLAIRCSR